jgi:hypothetical protein
MMPQLDFWAVGAFLAVMALLATLRQSLPFAAAQRAGGVIGFLTSPIWLVPLILAMAGVIGLMLTGAVSPWPPEAQAEFAGKFGAWAGITGFVLVVVVDLWLVWTPSMVARRFAGPDGLNTVKALPLFNLIFGFAFIAILLFVVR